MGCRPKACRCGADTLKRWYGELAEQKQREQLGADLLAAKRRLRQRVLDGGDLALRAPLAEELAIKAETGEPLLDYWGRTNGRVPSAYLFGLGRAVKAKPGPKSRADLRKPEGAKQLFEESKSGKTMVRTTEQGSAQVYYKFTNKITSYEGTSKAVSATGGIDRVDVPHARGRRANAAYRPAVPKYVQLSSAFATMMTAPSAHLFQTAALKSTSLRRAAGVEDLHNRRCFSNLVRGKPLVYSQDSGTKGNRHHLVQMVAAFLPEDDLVVEEILEVSTVPHGGAAALDAARKQAFETAILDEGSIIAFQSDTWVNFGVHNGALVRGARRTLAYATATLSCLAHVLDGSGKAGEQDMSGTDLAW
jgi:hypothetical protein